MKERTNAGTEWASEQTKEYKGKEEQGDKKWKIIAWSNMSQTGPKTYS